MIKIVLCDDEAKILSEAKNYIEKIQGEVGYDLSVEVFQDARLVLEKLKSSKDFCDILMIDIEMPDLTGLEMARFLRDAKIDVILIFMTAHTDYVFQSFEYAPFRYIRKEFMKLELLPALQAACEYAAKNRDGSIVIKTSDELGTIRAGDILYYELENRKCIIYTTQGKYETWKNIRDLRQELGGYDESFIQLYRGCMVNKRYIKTIKNQTIILENGIELPISRRKKKEISEIMLEYWSGMV